MLEIITHSRSDCFKTCRKKHLFSYEYGIRSVLDGKALRMGSAGHAGLEALGKTDDLAVAAEAVRSYYASCPPQFDAYEWEIECETVLRLICGYEWRWADQKFKYVACEQSFELPLTNPATGAASKTFALGGKIDGIVELEDGRLAVLECKFLGDDIGRDSELWRRMRIDSQISLYVVAARRLGFAVDCVMYNVVRKPTIKPTPVPLLDDLGLKIVNDANGNRVRTEKGAWRQTGSTDNGWTLQTIPMSVEEWGEKLATDISQRPEYYFNRVEIARLDQDLAEFESELWDVAKIMRDAQVNDRHYRTANKMTCTYCPYFDLCCGGYRHGQDALNEKYEVVNDKHPELERNAV